MISKKFAILGYPIEHSRSPELYRKAFAYFKWPHVYHKLAIKPSAFDNTISHLKSETWAGFNITVPYKSIVLDYLDEIDDIAQKIGSVNTIRVGADGKWKGYNTDYLGFLKPIENRELKSCLLIGSGGAARAVAFGLATKFKLQNFSIINRSVDHAQRLRIDLERYFSNPVAVYDFKSSFTGPFDLIVNATSIGLNQKPEPFPVDTSALSHAHTIHYDLIYHSMQTPFLTSVKNSRGQFLNGWPMLVFQASEAFKIWTNENFPELVLKKLLKQN